MIGFFRPIKGFQMAKIKQPQKTMQKTEIVAVDSVWSSIKDGAQRIVDFEPALASFIISSVLNHASFEEALSHRLAQRLNHSDLPAEMIRQIFDGVLSVSSEIGEIARADIVATMERDPACHRAIEPFLYFKGFQALQTHRFANALLKSGRKDMALYFQSRASAVFQADINPNVSIGKGVMIDHGTGVVIGETAVIGDCVSILQGVTLGGTGKEDGDRHPKVSSGVLIGAKMLGLLLARLCLKMCLWGKLLRVFLLK